MTSQSRLTEPNKNRSDLTQLIFNELTTLFQIKVRTADTAHGNGENYAVEGLLNLFCICRA